MHWSVIGHDEQRAFLARAIERGELSHAYLFSGPDGVGKHSVAYDIVRALVGTAYAPAQHPDVRILAPQWNAETEKFSDIAVEAVRDMKAWAYQRPMYGSYKIICIDAVDQLSDAAANTLLKVLEEPPAYVYFLLLTARSAGVLPTVASRCQEVIFNPLSDAQLDEMLRGERIDADDRKLVTIVARGRPGAALSLIRGGSIKRVAQAIHQFERLRKAGVAERLIAAKELADSDDASDIVAWWLAWVHEGLPAHPEFAADARGLLLLSEALAESKFNRRLAFERYLLEGGIDSTRILG